jgi:DNA-damage-inducible protein D
MDRKELLETPIFKDTMAKLESTKRVSSNGVDYWMAREIHNILGYPVWDKFLPVIERAQEAFRNNKIDPSHHIAESSKMMGVGGGATRTGLDYFLDRPACYLIAMNGEPSKPEIAAAQAYFAIQTRRMELENALAEDEKRLQLREKVSKSHRRVSAAAKDAGVRNVMQGIFHDARYQGLYGMPLRDVRLKKGLADNEQLYDRAGPLELSTNDFQMNLAADILARENVKGERLAIDKNREIAGRVRNAILDSGGRTPEHLALDPPIKEIKKRLANTKRLSVEG